MLLAANLPCPRGALIDFHLDTGVRTNSLQLGKLLALAAAAPRVDARQVLRVRHQAMRPRVCANLQAARGAGVREKVEAV
jgi:hypothetical protein